MKPVTQRAKMLARVERKLEERNRPEPAREPGFSDWWLSATPEEQAKCVEDMQRFFRLRCGVRVAEELLEVPA